MKIHVTRHLCRLFQATTQWLTRSDDFSRPIAVKATEVATTLFGIFVCLYCCKCDINVAVRMESLWQS